MIEAIQVSKSFHSIQAVDSVSATIKEGNVFGLIGTNGAGKSTFLRMLSGVLKPDKGSIMIDGMEVYENESAKNTFFYISDEQFFLTNSTPTEMGAFYAAIYKLFDKQRFEELLGRFGLDKRRKINTFSKGMKKQLSIICGICANTKYLFCDETFDGLDPVMRQGVKSIFAGEIAERGMTPIIASHNLRELEDICDHIGLLHKGGILLSRELEEMKCELHKIQCVFSTEEQEIAAWTGLEILKKEKRGTLCLLTVKGNQDEILKRLQMYSPVFLEALPLSLEEIFISETEVVGYDIKKLIF